MNIFIIIIIIFAATVHYLQYSTYLQCEVLTTTREVKLDVYGKLAANGKNKTFAVCRACIHYLLYIYFTVIHFSEILELTRYSSIRVEIKFTTTTTTTTTTTVFSSLYSRIKIFVFAVNSKRHLSIFV